MAVCSTTTFRKYLTQLSNFGQPLREGAGCTTREHAEGETLTTSVAYRRSLFKSGQDGRARPSALADHRRQRGGTLGCPEGGTGWLMAGAYARPQAPHAGAGGAGQQDGPHRLGAAGARWGLSSSGCGGVGAVTTARLSRSGKVRGEGWRTVKRPDQENQLCDKRFKRVGLNWT